MLRLLDEADETIVVVELDGAVFPDEIEVADVVERDRARLTLAAPPAHVVGDAGVEEVVARDDEEVVFFEPRLLDDEADVADRAEPVVLARRPVVVHIDLDAGGLVRFRPAEKRCGELVVGDDVHAVDLVHLEGPVEHVVDHRPPADG